MSAAATAAGYLYASGRLRGRAAREQEHQQEQQPAEKPAKKQLRVAVLPPPEEQQPRPRRTPKIEYRRKRWTPE
jgi:hypothetical protein